MVIAIPTSRDNNRKTSADIFESTENVQEMKTELETKLENLLHNIEGVGQVQVMLMTENRQGIYAASGTEVTGVLIVAEGADNSVTVRKIQEAVMALFQIDAHKIRIMKMK